MPDKPDLPTERLADIYGGDPRRWPAAEGHKAIGANLSKAEAIDHFLDGYAVPMPSSALIGRIIASTAHPQQTWSRARLWWSGLGLTGIALTGAVAGALAISVAAPTTVYHHGITVVDDQMTAFDAADPGESDL